MFLLKVVQVAVEQAFFSYDKPYSYAVPSHLTVRRGCRVLVPFGGGNRRRQGIVTAVEAAPIGAPEADAASAGKKLKLINMVLDKTPLLDDEMMDLALWLKERTFCTVFDVIRSMLPTGLYMRIKPVFRAADAVPDDVMESLSTEEKRLLDMVRRAPEGISREKLMSGMGLDQAGELPEELVKKGVLVRADDASRLLGDSNLRMVRPLVTEEELDEEPARSCTEKQTAVLKLLLEVGCASVKELCYFASVTEAVVKALHKKELVEYYQAEVLRKPYRADAVTEPPEIRLNPAQQRAYDGLLEQYTGVAGSAALLYGITGSGKTSVYLKLIDQVLAGGRQVLVMVPEIALTPQMIAIFLTRYGNRVAVLHSGLAIGERMDEWKRIKRGGADVVIGTRSAVFAPLNNIGMIVMDEEQEHTYKSESNPRYHARDAAKFRCHYHKALLLLSSATPSVESYHAALSGRYKLYELPDRYGGAGLPEVEIVDRRGDFSEGIVGERLRQAIIENLEQDRQAILLLNRRGYHTNVSCRSCGYTVKCRGCEVAMTYHRANGRMLCHYCGHMQPPPVYCPECGSDKIRYAGLGTQKVEEELAALFPSAGILRMDTDTTMSRFAYDQKFGEFSAGKYDIMIGTQMVAKGLDFPRVGLVGVLSADNMLYNGDFRSFETAFALLTQVIGRAGRRDRTGLALIQTYSPESYVIALASRQDYKGFYEVEIAARKAMKYPPFTDLCLFGFVGIREDQVKSSAFTFLKMLYGAVTGEFAGIPVIVLDPAPAVVPKTAGKYRYKLLMKSVNTPQLRELISRLLTEFNRRRENKDVTMFVDINPLGML